MRLRLKEIREDRHMTQVELAEKLGVGQSFISRVERGTKALPLSMAYEISQVLKCSIDEIVKGIKKGG